MVETKVAINNYLQPNIQDLQKDVLELLKDISNLMGRAKKELSNNNADNKYGDAQKEIDRAIYNVANLELRMAIVAPMKAGKSTIINAIVGQDLLPSRNAAMTTIPTKISFNNSLEQPLLVLSTGTLSILENTWNSLQEITNVLEELELESRISQYPHLITLAKAIQQNSFNITSEVSGKENINLVLTKLNDIVRLCCILNPQNNPLDTLEDIPNIQTPFWRNQNNEQAKQFGNLVIVDTPGPNELGEHLRLTAVVEQELKRCSIVLIVLDFTQLNNQAAVGVKQQVQPIIELIGKENLYVLVNKVDQRLPGDLTPEEVKKFVYSDLNLSETEDSDCIFELSARQAFSATKFLLELQQKPDLEFSQMVNIEALAKQVLGNRWSSKLARQTKESLQEEAEYLWQDSGCDRFISDSIKALIASAAPKCMLSATNRSYSLLNIMKDDLNLRAKAILQDAEKLETEINALTADLQHLELVRSRLKTVDDIKQKLQANLDNILKQLKQEARVSIESHFKEEDNNRSNILEKIDRGAREKLFQDLGGINILPKSFIDKMKYKAKDILEFDSQYEAEKFANEAIAWAKHRANNLLSQGRKYTEKEIELSQSELITSLAKETKNILENARKRLNKTFDLELSLPPNPQVNHEIGAIDFKVNSLAREVTNYKTKKHRPWYFLFIVEVKKQVAITRTESYYTISLKEIVQQINTTIETNIEDINSKIIQYLDIDFKESVDCYFSQLDAYLSNYRNSLKQAQVDGQLDIKKKEQLVVTLKYLISEATTKSEKTADYQTRIKDNL
jgi:GTPase Era involved in 16S rRNA processing